METKLGANTYDAGYKGEYGRFREQKTDDFENHELFADAAVFLDVRNRLNLRLQYLERVDPRGTLNLTATPTPNEWHQPSIQALYVHGAEGAQGRIEIQGGHLEKRYVNNRFATAALDRNDTDYGATFLWRAMPKTYLSVAFKQSVHDYVQPGSALNSTDTFGFIGVRWDATALTSGRLALGRQTKRFDSATNPDFSALAWERSEEHTSELQSH